MPKFVSMRMRCTMTGVPESSKMGLGRLWLNLARRVPKPAAKIIPMGGLDIFFTLNQIDCNFIYYKYNKMALAYSKNKPNEITKLLDGQSAHDLAQAIALLRQGSL